MACGLLGNTKGHECGRPIFFGVTQESLASNICTPSKLVIRAFGFTLTHVMLLQEMNEDRNLFIASLCLCNVILHLYMSCLVTHDIFNFLVRANSGCFSCEYL